MISESSRVVPLIKASTAVFLTAQIVAKHDDKFILCIEDQQQVATLMFSCLVQPEPGDTVLYCRQQDGILYIAGIVSRPKQTAMNLQFPANARISTPSGSLALSARDSIDLATTGTISHLAGQILHKSHKALFDCHETVVKGTSLHASIDSIRLLGKSFTSMANQVIQHCKHYIRNSTESDQVKAAQMSRDVSGLYNLDSKYTIMISKKDTKIDGQRIHMG